MKTTIIALDTLSALILMLVMVGCRLEYDKKNNLSRIFFELSVVGFGGTVLDLLSFVVSGIPKLSICLWVLNGLTLICATVFGLYYCHYIIAGIQRKKEVNIAISRIPQMYGGLVILVMIIGTANGMIFKIKDGAYLAGPLYFPSMIMVLMLGIYSGGLIIAYRNCFRLRESAALFSYIVAPFFTTLLEMLISGLSISYVGLSLATLMLYTFIQSEEIKNSRLNEEAAKKAAKEKSDFIARFSHELRTPINAILGFDEMILREASEDDIKTFARNVKSAGNSLLGIVNDILDSSKIEADKVEIFETEYDTVKLINDAYNMMSSRASAKNIELKVDVDSSLPKKLWGDEVKIKQIITNLVSNAVKYTEKGSVELRVSSYNASDNTVRLRVEVVDTGIGIKKEEIEKLFKPFSRIDELRNRYVEGTGLGMFITQSYLGMMGSRLEVKSEYEHGSTFAFELEQKIATTELVGDYAVAIKKLNSDDYNYKALFTAPDARILIVDDNKVNLVVCKSLLKDTLIKCDTAISGNVALSMCAKKKYDLILMDQMMPEMDGVETMYRIKSEEASLNKTAPIIALTANIEAGAKEMLLATGFDEYLTKPIEYENMEKMLMRFLLPEKVIKSN